MRVVVPRGEQVEQIEAKSLKSLIVRSIFGGILMGMANLVPGISGGTMLLAVGIYAAFIGAIADVSTFRFSRNAIATLVCVIGAAFTVILLGAGSIKDFVVFHRWIAYSLFIGLTFGGVPLIWRLAKPVGPAFWGGTIAGFAVMVVMAIGLSGLSSGSSSFGMLFFAGIIGSVAMVLPGISGGYMLLLLGQYEAILGAVDMFKHGLRAMDMGLLMESAKTVIPVGLGVLSGIAGVSNLLKWLLKRFEAPTLGVLFGLLLGAVIGLWPFQEARPPIVGDMIRGQLVSAANLEQFSPEKWPLERFVPTPLQIVCALALIVLGYFLTQGIDRLGREKD